MWIGVPEAMIESEGLTENVRAPRHDVIAKIVAAIGVNRMMFEAADPTVFTWHVKTYGPEANLFVDHSQIVQLEALLRNRLMRGKVVQNENPLGN